MPLRDDEPEATKELVWDAHKAVVAALGLKVKGLAERAQRARGVGNNTSPYCERCGTCGKLRAADADEGAGLTRRPGPREVEGEGQKIRQDPNYYGSTRGCGGCWSRGWGRSWASCTGLDEVSAAAGVGARPGGRLARRLLPLRRRPRWRQYQFFGALCWAPPLTVVRWAVRPI